MVDPTDLELLELHAEGLRGLRLIRCTAAGSPDVGMPPELVACAQLLVAAGWNVEHYGVLVYVIEPPPTFVAEATVLRSDQAIPPWLREANPGNWHPVEWDDLLDGQLGPWTMICAERHAVSICHTPIAMSDRIAECGTWTDPAFRGRGYAAATTAHWAELLRPSGRHLYYCHDPDNVSSRRVAQRLRLRLLGYEWGLRELGDAAASDVHPLSRMRPQSLRRGT